MRPKIETRYVTLMLALVVGLAPALTTFALVAWHLQADFSNFLPVPYNDQIYYWHQILTFSEAGFKGGYYSLHERIPQLGLFHFGAAGPMFPLLYGGIGRLVGWGLYTGILLNMLVVALSTWVLFYALRFDRVQILLTGLVLLAVGPVLMYMPSLYEESLNQAVALILVIIFYRLLGQRGAVSRRFYSVSLGFLIVVSLIRFSWALLFLPFFLLTVRRGTFRSLVLAVAQSIVVIALVLLVFNLISAPGNNSIFNWVNRIVASPAQGLSDLLNGMRNNIEDHLRIPEAGLTAQNTQVFQFFLVSAYACWNSFLFFRFRRTTEPRDSRADMPFHAYNLLTILVLSLLVYLPDGYYRVFAAHLLLTVILLVAFRRFWPVLAIVAVALLLSGAFLSEFYNQRNRSFTYDKQVLRLDEINQIFREELVYRPDATSPWCNTLLLPLRGLHYGVTAVPGGIGVSFFINFDSVELPVKSSYLLLDDATYEAIRDKLNVEERAVTPVGVLYRNLDAACPA